MGWVDQWLKGGYAETIAVIEGLLAAGFLALFARVDLVFSIAGGLALTALLWYLAGYRDKDV
jgi:type IV secretory pathway VirB2 component (pilin)